MIICLHKGKGLISSLIRFQTRGRYTHASILIKERDVIEAREFKGVVESRIELIDSSFNLFKVTTTREQDEKIISFLKDQLGKEYDYTMVARFVTRRQEHRKSKEKWFCSELVFAAFLHAGINLLERTEPWEVSPNLLSRSPLLNKIL